MEQTFLNWLYGIATLALSAGIKWLWESHKEMVKVDRILADKISRIEVLVAGSYITRQEFDRTIERLFDKLDHIESKLEK